MLKKSSLLRFAVWAGIALVVTGAVGVGAQEGVGLVTPIKEGKDTTRIVGYLDKKTNIVNYHRYINEVRSKGLKPSDNAMTWLVKLYGQETLCEDLYIDLDSPEGRLELKGFLQRLGMRDVPAQGVEQPDVGIHEFVLRCVQNEGKGFTITPKEKKQLAMMTKEAEGQAIAGGFGLGVMGTDNQAYAAFKKEAREKCKTLAEEQRFIDQRMKQYDEYSITIENRVWSLGDDQGWTAKAFPYVHQWYEKNKKFYPLIEKMMQSPSSYWPLLESRAADDFLIGAMLPHLAWGRHSAHLMRIRLRKKLGEGDLTGAIKDALLIMRFGKTICQTQLADTIESLVGISILSIGLEELHILIRQPGFDRSHAKLIWEQLDKEIKITTADQLLDQYHRFVVLDAAIRSVVGEVEDFLNLSREQKKIIAHLQIDSNLVLQEINRFVDRDVKQLRSLKIGQAFVEAEGFDEKNTLKQLEVFKQKLAAGGEGSGKQLSKIIARMIWGQLMPSMSTFRRSILNMKNQWGVMRLHIALKLYHNTHQRFPDRLAQIVGQRYGVSKLPVDQFDPQGKPIRYAKMAKGKFKLWSVFEDGIDGGGKFEPHGEAGRSDGDYIYRLGDWYRDKQTPCEGEGCKICDRE